LLAFADQEGDYGWEAFVLEWIAGV
jgi:hypothetical protein